MFKKDILALSVLLGILAFFCLGMAVGHILFDGNIVYIIFTVIMILFGYTFKHKFIGKGIGLLGSLGFIALTFEKIYIYLFFVLVFLAMTMFVINLIRRTENRVQHIEVHLTEGVKHAQITQDKWFDPSAIRDDSYTFQDIHDTSLIGDTIINLAQTILPDTPSVIVLHKGFGDIRILVPLEVGVSLSTHTLYGNVFFENEDYQLKNAKLTMFSNNYATATKKLKIVTTVYIGNVEVVYL